MAQLQPDIMIVDGANQNGSHARIVSTEGIRKDLIAHQRSFLRCNAILRKAFPDALGEGFLRTDDATDAILVAEDFYTVTLAVGNNAELNLRITHFPQPCGHFVRWDIGGIRHDGIIKIHHEQADITHLEIFRFQIRQFICDQFGKQGKRHNLARTFIDYEQIIT